MAKLNFYRQTRQDGGSRTGLEINNVLRLMNFVPGTGDPDPALAWYVDVRCDGNGVPAEKEPARLWLLQNAPRFQDGLHRIAEELQRGIDDDIYPVQRVMLNPPAESTVKLVCSAMRREEARDIAQKIEMMKSEWDGLVNRLNESDVNGA